MQIVIDIPKEFEKHFNSDRFEDSLQRVRFDVHKFFIGNKVMLSGNYEIETLDMLTEAFLNGTPLPKGHGRLIDVDAIPEQIELKGFLSQDNAHLVTIYRVKEALDNAPTIIEADRSDEE